MLVDEDRHGTVYGAQPPPPRQTEYEQPHVPAQRRPERHGENESWTEQLLRERLAGVDVRPFTGPLARAEAAGARWCEPLTVVEVSHTGVTEAGRLWHPVFRGVRDDLDPVHVEREG